MSLGTYVSEPLTNFDQPANRQRMQTALARVKAQLGHYYPLVIGQERQKGVGEMTSINPSNPDQVVGRVAKADKAHLHGVVWAGYILNMADNERLKHLNKLVNKYGKKEATDELLYMLAKYQGKPKAETVLKSDLSYIKYGKFQED